MSKYSHQTAEQSDDRPEVEAKQIDGGDRGIFLALYETDDDFSRQAYLYAPVGDVVEVEQ